MKKVNLTIISQRFPYPPRRGDQLAVSKMIDFCAKNKIPLEIFICEKFEVSDHPAHLNGKVIFKRPFKPK